MRNRYSLFALVACWLLMTGVGIFYYPKWNKGWTEATLSWDVSGYYLYLPALFINKDIKSLERTRELIDRYGPTPDLQQAFLHSSGNYVMKYASGMAVQYLPAFGVAHLVASNSKYPADGFSRPYQVAIGLWSLLVALTGIWFLRKILLRFFSDGVSAITLFAIVFATNYLDYSAINGAMSHNYLFTLYCLLIWLTIKFYDKPTWQKALGLGALVGLATLTRPTEVVSVLIPLLWGLGFPLGRSIKERFVFVKSHFTKYLVAGIAFAVVGCVQLIYWKTVAGEWFVYSYEDQGFSWLKPHLRQGFLSYNSGWLIYTPVMFFAMLGLGRLYAKQKEIFLACTLFVGLFIYIAFSWDEWWYGGSLGQRSMVQAYPVLAIALGAFLSWSLARKWLNVVMVTIIGVFASYNLWLTHQAHKGGMYSAGQMTKAYFWKVFGKFKVNETDYKLLDTDEEFAGNRSDVRTLLMEDFESDSSYTACSMEPIDGRGSLCLNAERQLSPHFTAAISSSEAGWARAIATFRCQRREWNTWRMTELRIRFINQGEQVKEKRIRVFRLLQENETQEIWIDSKVPAGCDSVRAYLWHANGTKPLLVDNLAVESFN